MHHLHYPYISMLFHFYLTPLSGFQTKVLLVIVTNMQHIFLSSTLLLHFITISTHLFASPSICAAPLSAFFTSYLLHCLTISTLCICFIINTQCIYLSSTFLLFWIAKRKVVLVIVAKRRASYCIIHHITLNWLANSILTQLSYNGYFIHMHYYQYRSALHALHLSLLLHIILTQLTC